VRRSSFSSEHFEHLEHFMAHRMNIQNFSKFASVDWNVSAELDALKDEVNNKFAGKFFGELDNLKALTQQINYFGMV
jgi:hypothetical protein